MTNHWVDMMNADVVMIMGSNAASCHPISARWIQKAKDKGAILIVADPRYTRTAAYGDVYVKFRSGTDIAFVSGMINYALQNDYVHKEYVVNYTDAAFIVAEGYGFHDGLFTGYNPAKREYDAKKVKELWTYELDASGIPKRDPSLQHPRCVYQLMKKHFSRYDMETVCNITGTPIEDYRKACQHYTSTWVPDRVGTWLYAMGATQSTHGTQNIRTYAIMQLLLGNIGRAGGGVNAMRGESNVQGSTDHALLFHLLPGYLKCPTEKEQTLADYIDHFTPKSSDPKSANWWQNTPKYIVSMLKAWYGDKATPENQFCFNYLPKATGNLSHIPLFEAMYEGKLKGLFILGQNPAVGGPNASKERKALEKLEWMVAADLFETETASFWKAPGVDPKSIKTEVFLLPACSSVEKEGSITGSGRWAQWRWRAIHPVGESRSDLRIVSELCKALKKEYAKGGAFPEPILDLAWDYGSGEEPDPNLVAREINGRFLKDADFPDKKKSFKKGQQVPSFAFLKDDGSTACGTWIYCGSYTDDGNMMARRDSKDSPQGIGLFPNWAWCWPVNRRILYNRASVDPQGRPWDPKRWVIRWNPALKDGKGDWEGDVPDGPWPPGDKHPYIMVPSGHAQLFAASLKDGPFPEHYEPLESPVKNPMSSVQFNPAVKIWEPDKIGTPDKYPVVATTFRMAEHWQAGAMTRNVPWLVELVPDVFIQIGTALADRLGVSTGDRVVIDSARGSMEAYALITSRIEPLKVDGRTVDQIAIPWHFGFAGLATGDSANMLTPHVGDANTTIPEYKVFLCNVTKKGVA